MIDVPVLMPIGHIAGTTTVPSTEMVSNSPSEWMNGYMNECLDGPVLHGHGAKGKVPYSAAHLRQGTGSGCLEHPFTFSPSRAGSDHQISAHRRHQTLPSLAFPRLQMLPRKALAWSQQDSLELAVGTGALDSPTGVTEGTRGHRYQWQYLVVVGEFLTGRDT